MARFDALRALLACSIAVAGACSPADAPDEGPADRDSAADAIAGVPVPVEPPRASYLGDFGLVVPPDLSRAKWISVLETSTWVDPAGRPLHDGERPCTDHAVDPSGERDSARALNCLLATAGSTVSCSEGARRRTCQVASVLYFPPGTYAIQSTLLLRSRSSVSLVGAGPDATRVSWRGPEKRSWGGDPSDINWPDPIAMLIHDGGAFTRFAGITWDGGGVASIGVKHTYTPELVPGTTVPANPPTYAAGKLATFFNEHANERFVGLDYGIVGGTWPTTQMTSETTIVGCEFIGLDVAGVTVAEYNALDWWIWSSVFDSCGVGVTNRYRPSGAPAWLPSSGNFNVYHSEFRRSRTADIYVGTPDTFYGIRENNSDGAAPFLVTDRQGTSAMVTLQMNRIGSPVSFNGVGPLFLFDNILSTATPAVQAPGGRGPAPRDRPRWDEWLEKRREQYPLHDPFPAPLPSDPLREAIPPNPATVVAAGNMGANGGPAPSVLDPEKTMADALLFGASVARAGALAFPSPARLATHTWRRDVDQDLSSGVDACGRQSTFDLIAQAIAAAAANPCARNHARPPVIFLGSETYKGSRTIIVPPGANVVITGGSFRSALTSDDSTAECRATPRYGRVTCDCSRGDPSCVTSPTRRGIIGWDVQEGERPVPIDGSGDETSAGPAGPIFFFESPAIATLENVTLDGRSRRAPGILVEGVDLVSALKNDDLPVDPTNARVHASELAFMGVQRGVWVDGVRSARTYLNGVTVVNDAQPAIESVGLRVTGRPEDAGSFDPTTPPNVILTGGNGSDGKDKTGTEPFAAFELAHGGRIAVRDFWFEGATHTFASCRGSGQLLLQGGTIALGASGHGGVKGCDESMLKLEDGCQAAIVATTLAGAPISLDAGAGASVLALGNLIRARGFSSLAGAERCLPSAGDPRILWSMTHAEMPYSDGSFYNPYYLKDPEPERRRSEIGAHPLLTAMRKTTVAPIGARSPWLTWLKLHRVKVVNSSLGLHIVGASCSGPNDPACAPDRRP